MIGFKPRISGVGRDGFTNCATTTARRHKNAATSFPQCRRHTTYLPTYLLTHKRVQTLKLIQVSQISKA